MAKGKRELIIETGGCQLSLVDFKKILEGNLKDAGFKYNEDIKFFYNIAENTVYCVSADGKQLKINF